MKVGNFLVAGNDKKMTECKNRLITLGYEAKSVNSDEFIKYQRLYDNIILPLPTLANGFVVGTDRTVAELSEAVSEKQKIFCGNISPDFFGDNAYSYYNNESFLLKNSRLTAQGVLKLILDNIERDVLSLKVAVLGYGRCGKAVCRLLKNCGFDVTCFARRAESRISANNDGIKSEDISDIDLLMSSFDITVNTIPANIINEECLKNLTQENLFIEIASKPYGFNISKADVYNFKYVLGESLPGKFTPVSAGRNIAETVLEIIGEVGYG